MGFKISLCLFILFLSGCALFDAHKKEQHVKKWVITKRNKIASKLEAKENLKVAKEKKLEFKKVHRELKNDNLDIEEFFQKTNEIIGEDSVTISIEKQTPDSVKINDDAKDQKETECKKPGENTHQSKSTNDVHKTSHDNKLVTKEKDGKPDATEGVSVLEKRVKKIEEKLKRDSLPKFSLVPDEPFYAFSLGGNFDLINGFSTNSLYSDLIVNLGNSGKNGFWKRFSIQFGTTRGLNTAPFNAKLDGVNSDSVAFREITFDPSGSETSQWNIYEINDIEQNYSSSNLITVYGRFNYRLICKKIRIYLTGQMEYADFKTDVTTISNIRLVDSDAEPFEAANLPQLSSAPTLLDTTRSEVSINYFFPSAGITLFNENENFDFNFTMLYGWRIIQDDMTEVFESPVLLTQAAILDKKVIGAKFGFEMRYFKTDLVSKPSYFFFISKQFNLQEFFEVFTPGGAKG